jgi:hypothetical protein
MPEKKEDKHDKGKRKKHAEKEGSQREDKDQPCGRKLESGKVDST